MEAESPARAVNASAWTASNAGEAVYLPAVTLGNLLYALALTLRSKVVTWRIDVPSSLSRRLELLRARELFSLDAWGALNDECFDLWKETVLPHLQQHVRMECRSHGRGLDLSPIVWQHLGADYRSAYQFVALANAHAGRSGIRGKVILPSILELLPSEALSTRFPAIRIVRSRAQRFADGLRAMLMSMAYQLEASLLFARSVLKARIAPKDARILWTGISPAEIPSRDDARDFSWPVRHAGLAREDVLFVLSTDINDAQRRYLLSNRIRFVERLDLGRLVPRSRMLRAALAAWGAWVKDLVSMSGFARAYRSRLVPRALVWDEILESTKARTYVTSTSVCWPERPEFACTRARSIPMSRGRFSLRTNIGPGTNRCAAGWKGARSP